MPDAQAAILEAVGDVLFSPAGAPTFFVMLVASSFLLWAQVWPAHRFATAVLRAAGLLTMLAGLLAGVHSHGWVTRVDLATTSWMVGQRSEVLDRGALVLTDMGGPSAVATVAVIGAALLSWRAHSVIPGAVVLATVAVAGLTTTLVESLAAHPRPLSGLQLIVETDPSLPSGSVAGTVALLGILAVHVGTGRRRVTQTWVTVAVCGAITIIAAGGVYVGLLWLSDVLIGALLAAVVVVIGAAVLGAQRGRLPDTVGIPGLVCAPRQQALT